MYNLPSYVKRIWNSLKQKKAKFKFQGQSARSQRWFDIDFYWIEVDFSTREPDLYKNFSEPWRYTGYKYI